MLQKILHKISGKVLFEVKAKSFRDAVELAVANNKDLSYADLSYADLSSADLRSADGIQIAGPVGSEGRFVTLQVNEDDTHKVYAGCWSGTLEELEKRIAPEGEHGWSSSEDRHRAEYQSLITYFRSWIESGKLEEKRQ